MKFSILLPTCDVPLDSGRSCAWLLPSLQSCQKAGHEDFECFVGSDGDLESVRSLVASLRDERFRYVPFPKTRTWGNYQRHELMKKWATGDYCAFMDHDDQYVPGALGEIAEQCELFGDRPIFARVRLACGIVIWNQPNLLAQMSVAGHACFAPRKAGWPLWEPAGDRLADKRYIQAVYDHGMSLGKAPVWSETLVALVRPLATPEVAPWVPVGTTMANMR